MYTQCPKCNAAFRVTAEVLRQAAGQVRCGSCGHAFNALEHLSEDKPDSRQAAVPEPDPQLPELKPDASGAADDVRPTSISPEQSAALLKTLDELAGSDIQLEDTGIEWRLLDEDDGGETDPAVPDPVAGPELDHEIEAPRPSLLDAELSADLESRRVDEVLSSSPTPVDEILAPAGDTVVESPEVFDAAASQTIPDEELRFDDNTGLPEDYDVEAPVEQPVVIPEPSQDAPEPMANMQVDLGFDDPDEWQDLLAEVGPDEAAAPGKKEMTLAEELEAIDVSDIEDDDEPPSGDELASQMEALSLELTGIQEELDGLAGEDDEPSIIDELAAIEIDSEEADEEALSDLDDNAAEPVHDDAAVEVALTAAASPESDAADITDDLEDGEPPAATSDSEPLDIAAIETEGDSFEDSDVVVLETTDDDDDDDAAADDSGAFAVLADDEDDAEAASLEPADDGDEDIDFAALEAEEDIELALDDGNDDTRPDADVDFTDTSIDDDLFAAAFESEAGIERGESAEPVVEPLSEEEQTINMMIDQDLLSIAVTDNDGFASTIVGTKESFEKALADAETETEADQQAFDAASLPPDATVETIIMSGEGAKSEDEAARAEALKEEAAAMIAAAKAEEAKQQRKPRDWRMVAGIVALALLLVAQAIHFSRDALAKVPVIHDMLAPIYDAIGMPLAPTWEVTGWRVEKTKGSIDASGETLNIYTEIGNLAGAAMPYPVIGVSLLDRFEESIGSRVFEPAEYLAGNVDRLALVQTGQRFSAEMTIESPTVAASGFRLNVCYRIAGSRLRCAIEDFR